MRENRSQCRAEHLIFVEGLLVPHFIFKTLYSKCNYSHYKNEETEAKKV